MKTELLFILSIVVVACACSGKKPDSPGVRDRLLAPCPDKPNCVSSQAGDKEHFIEPITYQGDYDRARELLIESINAQKRARIITDSGTYIHAEFTSKIFRFVDDVEFFINDSSKIIHLRSASRAGYSDMGVNRKRVETLRSAFNKKMNSTK